MNQLQIIGAIAAAVCTLVASYGYQRDEPTLLGVGLLGAVVGVLLFGIGRATAAVPRRAKPAAREDTSPGRFRVSGVDRASGQDVVRVFDAASPANARAKGEIAGMVVTAVERDYGL